VIRRLRTMSIVEAVTYLGLVAATVVKYTAGNERGVEVLGPIHGVLFLVFAGLLLIHYADMGWPWWKAFLAMIVGSLPFGGFWVERRWLAPLAYLDG
jgi:integral membrane protein